MYVHIPGKLSDIHLHARLFSNPCGNILIIVGISWSPDLRVQHRQSSLVIPTYQCCSLIVGILFSFVLVSQGGLFSYLICNTLCPFVLLPHFTVLSQSLVSLINEILYRRVRYKAQTPNDKYRRKDPYAKILKLFKVSFLLCFFVIKVNIFLKSQPSKKEFPVCGLSLKFTNLI